MECRGAQAALVRAVAKRQKAPARRFQCFTNGSTREHPVKRRKAVALRAFSILGGFAMGIRKISASLVFVWSLATAPAFAQQTQQAAAPIGSPGATTTIPGNQLPPPDPKFGGVIKESASESKPWWPPRVVPPKGAPNVLLIMTDDQGFG